MAGLFDDVLQEQSQGLFDDVLGDAASFDNVTSGSSTAARAVEQQGPQPRRGGKRTEFAPFVAGTVERPETILNRPAPPGMGCAGRRGSGP
jgi:hypothetical protein